MIPSRAVPSNATVAPRAVGRGGGEAKTRARTKSEHPMTTATADTILDSKIRRAVARLRAGIMAIVFGMTGGLGLFVLTAWLLARGGPKVGLHLGLLANYFPGYSVTWPGAVVGLVYGTLVGALVGWTLATIYNRIAFRGSAR